MISFRRNNCVLREKLPSCCDIRFAVTTPTPIVRGAVSYNLSQLGSRQLIETFDGGSIGEGESVVFGLFQRLRPIIEDLP